MTPLPVLGVPVDATALNGMDALMSIVQMPKGVPVATFAIGEAGAANAALFAASLLSLHSPKLRRALQTYRKDQRQSILQDTLPD